MLGTTAVELLLRDAEHHIEVAEWRIVCQLEHLEQMRHKGASTRAAEDVLKALKAGRDAWEARRVEILSRISLAPPLSSAA